MMKESPTTHDILAARDRLRSCLGIGITAAQDLCAEQVHTTRRVWQQWEVGARRMHPAFWELFCIKSVVLIHPPICRLPCPRP